MLLQQQNRYTISQNTWEAPAGHIDSDTEDPLDAAKRELLEETGLTSDSWISLGKFYANTGTNNSPFYGFVAKNVQVKSNHYNQDNEAIIQQKFIPLTTALQMARDGQIAEGLLVGMLYLANAAVTAQL